MKKFKIFSLTLGIVLAGITSCKDDSLVIVPEWESGVHGLGVISETSDDVNFIQGEPDIELTVDLLWNSIDNKNTVEKIEIFVLFNEAYLDQDNKPKTAKHGGDDGVLFLTLEGAEVPANKEITTFTLSQDNVFALFNGATYDYDNDPLTAETPVWGAGSINPDRNTADFKFVNGDSFQVRWEFTTEDGRVFDSWGPSVCNEFPGASCVINWAAVCAQTILNPVGNWTINFTDSYGDGWNGAAIKVVVNGVGTDYTLDDGFSGTTVVAVPGGTTTLTFEYVSGDWDSEASFTIIAPSGNTVAAGGPSQAEGVLTLNLCNE